MIFLHPWIHNYLKHLIARWLLTTNSSNIFKPSCRTQEVYVRRITFTVLWVVLNMQTLVSLNIIRCSKKTCKIFRLPYIFRSYYYTNKIGELKWKKVLIKGLIGYLRKPARYFYCNLSKILVVTQTLEDSWCITSDQNYIYIFALTFRSTDYLFGKI